MVAHTLWLDELFATYYVCRIQHDAKVRKKLIDVCDMYMCAVYSNGSRLACTRYVVCDTYMCSVYSWGADSHASIQVACAIYVYRYSGWKKWKVVCVIYFFSKA